MESLSHLEAEEALFGRRFLNINCAQRKQQV